MKRERILWAIALALGLALRLWFLAHPMPLDDDTDVYAELANNLVHHHVYGLETDGIIVPTLIRLPGYPLFLALVFAGFGGGNFHAVLAVQIAIDVLGCWLIASFVREQVSARAGTIAIFLAALCPFTAAYATIALTECLSIFAVSLALWSTGRLLRAQSASVPDRASLCLAALAMSLAMLLRPDGALLSVAVMGAILWCALQQRHPGRGLKTATLCGLLAIVPLAPWTLRNLHTFHVVQPLAPRRVNDPGEYVTYGFYRWMSTWAIDIVSTGNVFWRMGTESIDIDDLPARAFDSPQQRAQTAELFAEYNRGDTIPPSLDAKFSALASQRFQAHPFLCRVWIPILRVGDMWLRPRTETLGLDADWWRFDEHRDESIEAVALGFINLFFVTAAVVGVGRVLRHSSQPQWLALPIFYVLLRCALLSTMENSEPRYTLEAFPMVLACAACAFVRPSIPVTPASEH
jgi:4-amino-4-deoxy-L-arabinose transferase-like glycosyltransferase